MFALGDFRADLDKYYRIEFRGRAPSLRRRLKLWFTHFGLQCVAIYRLGRFCHRGRKRGNLLAWALLPCFEILCFLVKLVFQVDVFAAEIGPGFYIGHVGTLYIGPTVVGANFSVTHNVTVGMGATGKTHGLPVLGRDVWVGTGSILYGDIVVGDGVTINGGSVLSRSIPDRSLAGGNPGRVILRNYDNAHLFALPGWARPATPAAVEVPADGPASATPGDPPAAETAATAAEPALEAAATAALDAAGRIAAAGQKVEETVERVVEKAVETAVEKAMDQLVSGPNGFAVGKAVEKAVGKAMGMAVQRAVEDAVPVVTAASSLAEAALQAGVPGSIAPVAPPDDPSKN